MLDDYNYISTQRVMIELQIYLAADKVSTMGELMLAWGTMCDLAVGCILYIAGFASPYWLMYPGGNLGLWEVCSDSSPKQCISIRDMDSEHLIVLFHEDRSI